MQQYNDGLLPPPSTFAILVCVCIITIIKSILQFVVFFLSRARWKHVCMNEGCVEGRNGDYKNEKFLYFSQTYSVKVAH